MPERSLVQRLNAHVAAIRRRYPRAWDLLAMYRSKRQELGSWPDWCWVPLAGAYAIIDEAGGDPSDVGRVGAIGAWRVTQGVYEFDETLLDALWETDLKGDIPLDVLYRLPEWCVYVATPGRQCGPAELAGFFAHLEYDANDHRTELRLLLDDVQSNVLLPVPLHVWRPGGLRAAIDRALEEARFHARLMRQDEQQIDTVLDVAKEWYLDTAPLVSLVLYLCSKAAEVRDAKGSDRRPTRRQPERGAAPHPTRWEVGYRIGAALRAALSQQAEPAGGTHASPRPHVRRAHWHTYRVGPGRERAELRWIHPVLVGGAEVVPTVRNVGQ